MLPGKGRPVFTGKLGEVMKESIQAAVTVVRSRSDVLGLDKDFYSNIDFHVHLPEGATPKDGPSAGIGICTAMVSALTKIPVHSDVAMTGEITLRGEVLPIGGLKEKLLAAARGGIKRVLIPVENEKDLVEIPDNIKGNLDIKPVKWIDQVLEYALVRQPTPLPSAATAECRARSAAEDAKRVRRGAPRRARSSGRTEPGRQAPATKLVQARREFHLDYAPSRPGAPTEPQATRTGRAVRRGCLAQLVERRPYKANVGGSIPSAPTSPLVCNGAVVQLVRIPACHAGGRGFESRPLRHFRAVPAQWTTA